MHLPHRQSELGSGASSSQTPSAWAVPGLVCVCRTGVRIDWEVLVWIIVPELA